MSLLLFDLRFEIQTKPLCLLKRFHFRRVSMCPFVLVFSALYEGDMRGYSRNMNYRTTEICNYIIKDKLQGKDCTM